MGRGGTGSPNAGALEHAGGHPPTEEQRLSSLPDLFPRCCLALRWRFDGYTKWHTMTPAADGIECIMFAGDEQFSQVFSRTISKSLTSLPRFA